MAKSHTLETVGRQQLQKYYLEVFTCKKCGKDYGLDKNRAGRRGQEVHKGICPVCTGRIKVQHGV